MNKETEIRDWVTGVLSLVLCGGAHEIDDDEELAEMSAGIDDDASIRTEDGHLVITGTDGTRYRVIVEQIT